jgi:hypothetical protein
MGGWFLILPINALAGLKVVSMVTIMYGMTSIFILMLLKVETKALKQQACGCGKKRTS